ncbi:MAG: orotidine-5'-phosphate decarboxylase [Planctomycetaceae bacterium]
MSSYILSLHDRIRTLGTPALVGLDPRWDLLPDEVRCQAAAAGGSGVEIQARAFEAFCCRLIDVIADLVPAVKPQVAFFERLGPAGMVSVQNVIRYARNRQLMVIADAKRGDIGSTATAYADAWMAGADPNGAVFAANAVTVNAYMGVDTLQPFVDAAVQRQAGVYVLVRTSNPGAGDFQDLETHGQPLYATVADAVQQLNSEHWPNQAYGSIGAVVGATWPEQLRQLRRRMPSAPLLVPGFGSQGGTAADVVGAFAADGSGALINSSRDINFAWHRRQSSEQFGEARWEDAVLAATQEMISALKGAAVD